MKIKSLVLSALAVFAIGSAQAAVGQANTWTLQGATFDDGGTASGTFSVDASGHLTSFDITTTADPDYPYGLFGNHYTTNSGPRNNDFNDYIDITSGRYRLFLWFDDALNTSYSSINKIDHTLDRSREYINTTSLHVIYRGSVLRSAVSAVSAVPEPETYALMLAGLGVLGFVASRRSSL